MPSPESSPIRSYRLARRATPSSSLAEQRVSYELLLENYVGHPVPLPEGTHVEPAYVDGIPAEWILPTDAGTERVVLHLHGGSYILGSLKSHNEFDWIA
jgi:monoterpene epsilon-lactone hydrolase